MECASLLLELSFAGKGVGTKSRSPSRPQKSSINHRWIFVQTTCISEATVRLKKRNSMEPRSGRLSRPLPSSAPHPVAFLFFLFFSLFGFVSNFIWTFFGGCFSHETRPFPDLYCKLSCARARRMNTAQRGDWEGLASAPIQDCGDTERLRHFFKL